MPFNIGISPTLKIRGIIATQDIKKDQILEKCPIVLIPMAEEEHLKQTTLWKYYFEWNKGYHCMVLGYGSLFNHSYKPNAKYVFSFQQRFLVFKSIKDIAAGEEITVNYNFDPKDTKPLDPILLDYNEHLPK